MRSPALPRGLLVMSSAWLLTLACGSRSELVPGRLAATAGSDAGVDPLPECLSQFDCPQPPPGRCGFAVCNQGACELNLGPLCDDADPCTIDACNDGVCRHDDGRVDADGDGAFATGTAQDPKARLGCGEDCDDTTGEVRPSGVELCDARDNDCNGVVDDGTSLQAPVDAPVRVSRLSDASCPMSDPSCVRSEAAGLAFDGESFGASMTTWVRRSRGEFQRLDRRGNLLDGPEPIARVNAESYGGPLVWTGERYLTAYQDARQDDNYEIYFDVLNQRGQRLIEDLRVTNADDFSLRPALAWTGTEALLVWDDRRFEGTGDASALFGQRVSLAGELIGPNQRLTPPMVLGEAPSIALSDSGVGIAFVTLEPSGRIGLQFMTASRTLAEPSAPISVPFDDPDGPVVTALGDKYAVTFHQDTGSAIGASIFGVLIGKGGIELLPRSLTVGRHTRGHVTHSYGDRFVMVWADDKEGTYQLYAQSFDTKLAPITPVLRVTRTMSNTLGAAIAPASDGALGVLYTDEGSGARHTYFTRLDCRAGFQQPP
jgi:hypothetical protein